MKVIMVLACFTILSGVTVFGAETVGKTAETKNPHQLTTDQRKAMADLHEKFATCLRSDRAVFECRQEMMKGCEEAMGNEGCPMMGRMMRGKMGRGMRREMMHHQMMDEKSNKKE